MITQIINIICSNLTNKQINKNGDKKITTENLETSNINYSSNPDIRTTEILGVSDTDFSNKTDNSCQETSNLAEIPEKEEKPSILRRLLYWGIQKLVKEYSQMTSAVIHGPH